MKNVDWEELDTQALGAIRLSLSNEVRRDVIHEKTTKGLMDTLSEMFEKPSAVEHLRAPQGVGVVDLHARYLGCYCQLICSLAGKNKLVYNEVQDTLLSEETRRKKNDDEESSTTTYALLVSGRSSVKEGTNRGRSKSRSFRDQDRDKDKECFYCHDFGHIRYNCPKLKSKRATIAMVASEDDGACYGDALMATSCLETPHVEWILDTSCSEHMCPNRDWFSSNKSLKGGLGFKPLGLTTYAWKACNAILHLQLESRALVEASKSDKGWKLALWLDFHHFSCFTSTSSLLEYILQGTFVRKSRPCALRFCTRQSVGAQTYRVAGVGTIKIKVHDGSMKSLENVLHVPKFDRNLISLGTLDSKGHKIVGQDGNMKVLKGALVVMKGKKVNGLYRLEGSFVRGGTVGSIKSFDQGGKIGNLGSYWHSREMSNSKCEGTKSASKKVKFEE
ncbi:hypothetical protein ACLB2K_003200 [Fragaria x ananassa]